MILTAYQAKFIADVYKAIRIAGCDRVQFDDAGFTFQCEELAVSIHASGEIIVSERNIMRQEEYEDLSDFKAAYGLIL